MELIGAVVVALLGACVGLLVGLYLQGAKNRQLAEQAIAQRATARTLAEQAIQQRAAALGLLEKHHAEIRGHLMAMTAALADRMQLVGGALAAALRESNAAYRNDRRLALGLPRTSEPGEEPPATRPSAPTRPASAPTPAAFARPGVAPAKGVPAPTRASTPLPKPAALPRPVPPPRPTVTVTPSAPPSSRPTPTSIAVPTSQPARPAHAGDEPTPPSGWTLEQVRTHTATAGEERRS